MKSEFAFVYFEDERDGEDAIRHLDNTPFGLNKRRLSVEWARGERGSRHCEGSKSIANQRTTLFVINFDPLNTRTRDIEKHFEPFGKVLYVRIRRNFAFVQFDRQDEATKALECTHMSKILGRAVSVEYALRDDGEHGDRRDCVTVLEKVMEAAVTIHMAVLEVQFVAGVGQVQIMVVPVVLTMVVFGVQIMVVLGALFIINTMVHHTIGNLAQIMVDIEAAVHLIDDGQGYGLKLSALEDMDVADGEGSQ